MKTGSALCDRLRSAGGVLVLVSLALFAAPLHAQRSPRRPPSGTSAVVNSLRTSVYTVLAEREVTEPVAPPGGGTPRYERRHLTRVGSGVAVSSDGLILTTASVVLNADRVSVRSGDKAPAAVSVLGVDAVANVALLRLRGPRTTPVAFAEPASVKVGDTVITVGAAQRGQPSWSVGAVAWLHGDPRYSLVQVTNAVYPGYSGAAAVNARGLLVGIVQGELGSPETLLGADGSERRGGGAGIVIPVETLAPVLRRLQAEGRVRYGFLGVQTRSLSIESLSEQGEQVPLGALVENVVRGSPAAAGGLRSGDLIVAFEGDRVEYPGQLARWVAGTDPGTSVELVWVRDEVRQSARFTLIEAPPGTATLAGPAPRAQAQGPAVADKIQELEQQILRLSHELEQLKKQTVRR